MFLGDGNDSLIVHTDFSRNAIDNFTTIEMGDGNDIIASTGVIYNEGIINTGNGEDLIIVYGGSDGTGSPYGGPDGTGTVSGIYNNGGTINTGDGNDSIIANEGFRSGLNNSGSLFLGNGEDYLKGFGSGDFYGGNDEDTLELTPGSYTVGIWDTSAVFTKGNQLMITSEFEKLRAGSTIYDFTSLTADQIIIVA